VLEFLIGEVVGIGSLVDNASHRSFSFILELILRASVECVIFDFPPIFSLLSSVAFCTKERICDPSTLKPADYFLKSCSR
jgi:hypothetical protein